MTAAELLRRLTEAGCDPAVDGCDLTLAIDPPPGLESYVEVLHTGLRALLSGRRWFGFDIDGRGCGPGLDHALDPRRLLPDGVTHLCVEGFAWNAVGDDQTRHPELFEPSGSAAPKPRTAVDRPGLFEP